MAATDGAAAAGLVKKKSSEFRGTSRCRELRKYDGLDALLDTAKGAAYDEAILVKDIMRGYLDGSFRITDFMGLVEEGLDDGQMLLPGQREAKAERLCALLTRAASSETRKATFVKPGKVYAGGYEVSVCPDAVFTGQDWVELVLYRSGKPTVTQKGKKQDASVGSCLELYFLLRYARTMVPAGETWKVKASYYFMRKTTDRTDSMADMDFFSGSGGNVVTLEEEYTGGSTEETELDAQFLAQLEEFAEGVDGCQEDQCRYCKMYTQCYWQKSPKKYEKKTLEGKKGAITPSDAQQAVIDFREGYCKVNAGAGTGKTECMTERGARMFAEGTDPSKMLFITFTEAGATEMKERLVKKTQARGLDI
ncbi:MAG: UvrD-helicase domain-containing protein, partial [Ruminococcus flavefaciens]|nr:UvrD-helicase domain-containing protein [Ruminococcus flavefaciens]